MLLLAVGRCSVIKNKAVDIFEEVQEPAKCGSIIMFYILYKYSEVGFVFVSLQEKKEL